MLTFALNFASVLLYVLYIQFVNFRVELEDYWFV